jgi:hypothetical protein
VGEKLHHPPENKSENQVLEEATNSKNGLNANIFSKRKRKSRRFKRIGNGLFRYQNSGVIYGVFSVQGQTVWKNLNTTDRRDQRRMGSRKNLPQPQNLNPASV